MFFHKEVSNEEEESVANEKFVSTTERAPEGHIDGIYIFHVLKAP